MPNVIQDRLGPQGLENIKHGIEQAEQAIQAAELAIQAGIPMEPQLKQAKDNKERLLKMKNTFYPGQ